MRFTLRVLAGAALLFAAACQPAQTRTSTADGPDGQIVAAGQSGLATAPLGLVTAKGRFAFTVEIARTEAEQALGLMHRPRLAPDRGMIFPMRPARWASFWMKDTPNALDIVFIAPGGRVLTVAEMTQPYSLDQIDSGGLVEAVLEIAGGRAAEIGLKPGDAVVWNNRAGR